MSRNFQSGTDVSNIRIQVGGGNVTENSDIHQLTGAAGGLTTIIGNKVVSTKMEMSLSEIPAWKEVLIRWGVGAVANLVWTAIGVGVERSGLMNPRQRIYDHKVAKPNQETETLKIVPIVPGPSLHVTTGQDGKQAVYTRLPDGSIPELMNNSETLNMNPVISPEQGQQIKAE